MSRVSGAQVTADQTVVGPTVNGFATVYTQVNVSVPYKSFLIGGSTFTISATARMRNEIN
jgi:hypothetical protein